MATYRAPIDDMMFLFEKLRDNSHYNSLEKYKEVNSDLAKDILEQAAKLTENIILPLAKAGDETPAKLENGYEINVPLFINEQDLIRIDTRTGMYADRVSKG